MPLRGFLALMGLATVLAWAGWVLVLLNIDPFESGIPGVALFFVTLFAALIGTLSVFGTLFRLRVKKGQTVVVREVKIAVRHAVLLSLVAVVSLLLAGQGLLKWWNLAAMIVAVGAAEYVFLLVQESRRA
jgi:hypothetical protein